MKVKKGFTLLEIVIALAILAIMILPLSASLLTSVETNRKTEIKQENKLISQEIIEKIRGMGNIKNTTLNLGSNIGDKVEIKQTSLVSDNFDVNGSLGDIKITGNIKITENGKVQDSSDKYSKEKLNLLVCIDDNKIEYFYDNAGKTIDEFLSLGTGNGTLLNPNILKIILGEQYKVSLANGSNENFIGTAESIGIYFKEYRILPDSLVSLNIDKKDDLKKNPNNVKVYFFENKFSDKEATSDIVENELPDSFNRKRVIGEEVDVVDNIRYYPKNKRKNAGLYTINLEVTNKDISVKTVSEFMVSN